MPTASRRVAHVGRATCRPSVRDLVVARSRDRFASQSRSSRRAAPAGRAGAPGRRCPASLSQEPAIDLAPGRGCRRRDPAAQRGHERPEAHVVRPRASAPRASSCRSSSGPPRRDRWRRSRASGPPSAARLRRSGRSPSPRRSPSSGCRSCGRPWRTCRTASAGS